MFTFRVKHVEGFNDDDGDDDDKHFLPTLKYSIRPTARYLKGAARKYAGEAWYQVCSASAVVHRTHLVPCPSMWSPADRGKDTVCDVWYGDEDICCGIRS